MNTFVFKIITPREVLYQGNCESAVINASDGLYGIMAGHLPMTAVTVPGEVKIKENGNTKSYELGNGVFHFEDNEATLIIK